MSYSPALTRTQRNGGRGISNSSAAAVLNKARRYSSSDEELLVRAAKKGSSEAFIRLIKAYDDDLRALAFSITGSASDMDDVLQTAYLRTFQSMSNFKGNSSFKTWIYRIVHNVAIDSGRRRVDVPLSDETRDAIESPSSDRDAVMDVNAALDQLSADHRLAVLLVDGSGFDYATAAEIVGVPVGTLSSRVNQARTRLRSLLAVYDKDFHE